jgi:hypothetical protein
VIGNCKTNQDPTTASWKVAAPIICTPGFRQKVPAWRCHTLSRRLETSGSTGEVSPSS